MCADNRSANAIVVKGDRSKDELPYSTADEHNVNLVALRTSGLTVHLMNQLANNTVPSSYYDF